MRVRPCHKGNVAHHLEKSRLNILEGRFSGGRWSRAEEKIFGLTCKTVQTRAINRLHALTRGQSWALVGSIGLDSGTGAESCSGASESFVFIAKNSFVVFA
jgi:hypothetical protein